MNSKIFVSVQESEINNNNNLTGKGSPYLYVQVKDRTIFQIKSDVDFKKEKVCEFCLSKFSNFSELFTHQGKKCYQSLKFGQVPCPWTKDDFDECIQVIFPLEHLVYIEDCLKVMGLPVEIHEKHPFPELCEIRERVEMKKWGSITIDESVVGLTKRRLYFSEVTKYNLESWYNQIHSEREGRSFDVTPKSWWMEFDDQDLASLRRISSIRLSQNLGLGSTENRTDTMGRVHLERKVQRFIESINKQEQEREENENENKKKYFCKFSTRSPKDSVSLTQEEKEGKETNFEEKVQKKLNKLQVENGEQAIHLLSGSQRIFSDIELHSQFRIPPLPDSSTTSSSSQSQSQSSEMICSSSKLNLILREWSDIMKPSREFRCFVHKKRITAISQYNCYSKYDSLQIIDEVLKIRASIINFHFHQIKPKIKIPNYVLDVVVSEKEEKNLKLYEVQLIELNPFGTHMSSGAALFNWNTDYHILYDQWSNINEEEKEEKIEEIIEKTPIRILKELLESPKMIK